MKILELRFKNLNSLYGEWFIDFSAPEYISNGIFALTGPTGAGKSTILDAICLALYGATPRLSKITKSNNEIMSRQTGECYAEVTFESQAGRYRCHWSQHRARKIADGDLQAPRHEISEGIDNGKVIENQIRRVATVIEEKTGMDFERFTRSILLAQGGFDTFLKADEEQKSKILEQITGTEIYTEISRRVHERQREEREKLNLLQAETAGIAILEPEQEKEIKQSQEGKEKQESVLAAKVIETGRAIAWLTGIDGLKKEINILSEESEKLKFELESFKPERERLSRALNVAELGGEYATLIAARQQQKADQSTLKTEEGKLPDLESTDSQKDETLNKAEKLTVKSKEALRKTAPLIQKIRSLDQQLTDKKKTVDAGAANCIKDAKQIEADKNLESQEQKKSDSDHVELRHVLKYLGIHSEDEWLLSGLAGIEEQLGNLVSEQKEIAAKKDAEVKATESLKMASKKLESFTNQRKTHTKEVEEAGKRLGQGKKDLALLMGDCLLREYRTEKETLLREMAFLSKIADLEIERTKLEDDKPCPLCGAREHPFAEGNIPKPDEIEKKVEKLSELIHKAEEQEMVIKKREVAEKTALKNLADSEKIEVTAANEKKTAEKSLKDLAEDLKKALSRVSELKKSALAKLQPLGIKEIPDADVSSLLKSLKERLKSWRDQVKKKEEIEKQIADLAGELKRLEAVIETRKKTLAEKHAAAETTRKEYEVGQKERRDLFGIKSPDGEETRLNKDVTDAERAEKQARIARDEARQKLIAVKSNIITLRERIGKRISELEQLESKFASHLQTAGFTDEKLFLEASLTALERNELKTRAKEFDDRQTDLQARQKDRENRLSTEHARKISESKIDELEPAFKALEENLKQLRDAIAGLKHKLTENTAAKERIKEKQTGIEAHKKECHRWDKLHGLIGSADGKKYRNFAQGLTFELMVSHANRQLEKMTDRYLLIRDDKQPLELNVVDNYQAGEIRSTKNLSGGESFIVSLTLALGLSKMASRKVRVDSLFLDEGFGTLDEDALETALETLSGLQQDGKLIGIISHVSALKERISTQISINPVSGGKSTIIGPGCNKIN